MIGIYKITSPSGKIYIGQSINIERRFKQHKFRKEYKITALRYSFNKHGIDSHIFEIVEECLLDDLNNRERYYQDLYSVMGKNGLNCVLTQSTDKKGSLNEVTKEKLRQSLSKYSEVARNRMRTINTGKKFTDSHKSKISKANKGVPKSEEHKEKLRNINLGKKREFSRIILDLNTGIFYGSVQDAADACSKKYSTLANRLNGSKPNNTQFLYV